MFSGQIAHGVTHVIEGLRSAAADYGVADYGQDKLHYSDEASDAWENPEPGIF